MTGALFPDLAGVTDVIADPTDQDYATAARYALKAKSLPRALQQVAAALALAPLDEGHLRLLGEILAASRAPLLLVDLPVDGAFFGLVAVRAHLLARSGRMAEALSLLADVVVFRPSAPYLTWAVRWLEESPGCPAPDAVANLIVQWLEAATKESDASEPRLAEDGKRRNFSAALELCTRACREHPSNPSLLVARSRLLRASRRPQEALALLRTQADSFELAVERAALHHELNQLEDSVHWYRRAVTLEPEVPSIQIALADLCLSLGQLEAAANAYERAQELAPAAWTRAALAYTSWLANRGAEPFQLDDELLIGDERIQHLALDGCGYDSRLLEPHDPLTAVIRDALSRSVSLPPEKHLRVRVQNERPIAASAQRAFQLGLDRLGRKGSLIVETSAPTLGGSPLAHDFSAQTVARTPEFELVHELAPSPFSWQSWTEKALQLASSATSLAHLLVAAAKAPSSPDRIHPIDWVHRWQIAAAALTSASRKPWSERSAALELFLESEDDWLNIAGVLGLGFAAQLETAVRPAVVQRLLALMAQADAAHGPTARALGIVGSRFASDAAREPFIRLRVSTMMQGWTR